MIKDFFVNMLLLAKFDAVWLFVHYIIIWAIIEIMFYNIEKMIGVSTTYRWYDLVLTFTLIGFYVFNINYLLEVLKSRL